MHTTHISPPPPLAPRRGVVLRTALRAVRLYQRTFSPDHGLLHQAGAPAVCRFSPTCSAYAVAALERYGWRGSRLVFRRILRCHPYSSGGADPVP